MTKIYRQTSSISRAKSKHFNVSRIVHWGQVLRRVNENVVETAPTGYAPTISEWSTILLHTKVRIILEFDDNR